MNSRNTVIFQCPVHGEQEVPADSVRLHVEGPSAWVSVSCAGCGERIRRPGLTRDAAALLAHAGVPLALDLDAELADLGGTE